ncbi:photosynthetic complex putative assembly protein PuhB [Lichenifustis flavocetrariae]|uniref:Photosynthetic complex putative assembly protein PuhB n=1 Tax=Lichenifustis flavocetrariae TaxID=2949735 RepID=A0AA42CHI5_9HYPH|nr:photosynthetic complex putative assembly protein PuhB [Lichenifustis flavocetrariae]MCW6507309.1 photosynthetic complex putative assembly protein PuhB [Lichenifustis flavocetrariae]
MSGDLDFEPIRGLPARLPPGETLLWQGEPDLRAMALRVFHVRKVAIYFGLLVAYRLASALHDGASLFGAAKAALPLTGLGVAAVLILAGLAALVCRTTVYSITSRRVVMRIGVALPITFNLPFKTLASASLKLQGKGVGTIPLVLTDSNRLAYLVMWPHARPWRTARTEPALRFVPDAAKVAQILAEAVSAALPETVNVTNPVVSQAQAGKQPSWPMAPAAA